MHARVAAFENPRFGDSSLVDELTTRVRESTPRWREALRDAQGYLMLVDRENNRSVGITFFENEDKIREAEPVFERMGDEIPEELRGRRVSVETYEVLFQEVGEGARAARVSTFEGSPEQLDEVTRRSRDEILPRGRELPGWKGVISLADRRTGRTKLITLWESEDAMRSSEKQANKLRQETADLSGSRITGVTRYEVAHAERLAELGVTR